MIPLPVYVAIALLACPIVAVAMAIATLTIITLTRPIAMATITIVQTVRWALCTEYGRALTGGYWSIGAELIGLGALFDLVCEIVGPNNRSLRYGKESEHYYTLCNDIGEILIDGVWVRMTSGPTR